MYFSTILKKKKKKTLTEVFLNLFAFHLAAQVPFFTV